MSAVHDTAATPTLRGQFPTRPAEDTPPSRRERMVLALVSVTLVLSVWLVGAWREWALLVTLALACAAMAALFIPVRDYRSWPPSPAWQTAWRRLKEFPFFWIGLAILAYGAAAALNPSRVLMANEHRSWLEEMAHEPLLPHSVSAPFSPMNAWYALAIIAPAWLVVCAAWVGLETEQSWRQLLGLMACNGLLLALVGMAQALCGTPRLFGLFEIQPGNSVPEFFGSFPWAGHAAAWMTLAFGATASMLDHNLRRRDPLAPPRRWGWPMLATWWWLGSLLVMLLALGLFVKPVFWWLAAGVVLLVGVSLWLARLWREGQKRRAALYALPALVFMGVLLLGTGGAVLFWQQGGVASKLEVNPHDPELPARYAFARTSATMIKDEPLFGWGPGSFRYVSPYYLPHNPRFRDPANPSVSIYSLHYAYNDWVQYTAEWGLLGAGLFATGIGWWIAKAWRLRRVLPGESWIALGAVAMLCAEAAVDCPFYNPAVLVAAALLTAVAVKLGEIAARPRPVLSKVVVACS